MTRNLDGTRCTQARCKGFVLNYQVMAANLGSWPPTSHVIRNGYRCIDCGRYYNQSGQPEDWRDATKQPEYT